MEEISKCIQVRNQTSKEIIELFEYVSSKFNIFEEYNVDQYLTSYALVVDKSHRGHGIATEILKARVEILKAFDLTVTATSFSTLGSQIAGEKAGYDDIVKVSYVELGEKFPSSDFSKANTKWLRKVAFRIWIELHGRRKIKFKTEHIASFFSI